MTTPLALLEIKFSSGLKWELNSTS